MRKVTSFTRSSWRIGLNGALHGVEVHVAAVGAQGQYLGLDGQAVLAAGQVDPAHLIELGTS